MLIQKKWLKDYLEISESDEKIAELLSLSGSSIEEVIKIIDDKVVVVEIIKIEPHPNADRLRLATVFDGSKEITIVCGAPNIEVGQKVPLAKLGSKLPGGEISKANIRGVESEGMLCAADELGLGDNHDGVIVLDSNVTVGTQVRDILDADTIFDVEITANRGDCLSHIGIARELAVLTNQSIKTKDAKKVTTKNNFKIEIEDFEKCPQYYGLQINNVKVAESPEWLKNRLKASGIKSINNIVDATNFIMLDLGQPLHAFDISKIEGEKISVRSARIGEKIICLDKIERTLTEDNLVIADIAKPIAIAGVIGGANSEIDNQTKNILIEAAEFDSRVIRKSAKISKVGTEASYRFERGIDSGNVLAAAYATASLIQELAGGEIVGLTDSKKVSEPAKIEIDFSKVNQLLGTNLTDTEMAKILSELGFNITSNIAIVPSWRHDVTIWQDLAEEVARIYGYDNIKRQEVTKSDKPQRSSYFTKESIKNVLVEMGFSETFGYAFLSENDLKLIGASASDLVEVTNPVSLENKYLRKSLIPGLLKVVSRNPIFDPIAVFEIGHVFETNIEKTFLGLAVAGKNAKKMMNDILIKLGLKIEAKEFSGAELGKYKIRKPFVYVLELNIDELLANDLNKENNPLQTPEKQISYRAVSKYPSMARDLAFLVDDNISASGITKTIIETQSKALLVDLFDEFKSDKLGLNKKSLAFHIYFQDPDKALNDTEADIMIKEITDKIVSTFDAKLRD